MASVVSQSPKRSRGGYSSAYGATAAQDDEPELVAQSGPKKAGIPSSITNLTNTIIGAGMLAIPKAMKQMGMAVGLGVLMMCSIGGVFGLSLLVECARRCGQEKTSYYVVARKNVGTAATVAVDVAVALKCFGVAVAYLVVVGDLMPDAMEGFGADVHPFNQRRFWIGCAMAIVVPLSFLRKLDSLRFTSALSLCTAVYLVGLLFYFTVTDHGEDRTPPPPDNQTRGDVVLAASLNSHFLAGLPVMVFAFTCHQNIFTIHSELKDNTVMRTGIVISSSVAFTLSIYALVAVCGYMTYRRWIESNFINNLPNDLTSVNIGRIVMSLNVSLSFALQSHPCRECITNLVLLALGAEEDRGVAKDAADDEALLSLPTGHDTPFGASDEARPIGRPLSDTNPGCRARAAQLLKRRKRQWYYLCSLFICGAAFFVAWMLDDLGVVFGIVGGTGSTTLCYILPGGLYLRSEYLLAKRDGLPRPWDARRVGAAIVFAIGIIMVGVANWSTIDSEGGEGTGHEYDPGHEGGQGIGVHLLRNLS
eukprot:TRINITY_DN40527_c0_g1_i1.p1 TRINITY_DN40527_c0_g1~~TRINITY_DN40527_c0_g1_i1.p1  ORF type:complete len:534 (+),score=116.77 TRINITY_DN40527_c0_g1_i1:68-1669(+)